MKIPPTSIKFRFEFTWNGDSLDSVSPLLSPLRQLLYELLPRQQLLSVSAENILNFIIFCSFIVKVHQFVEMSNLKFFTAPPLKAENGRGLTLNKTV